MFFVSLATFFPKINDFSGICLSFLAIRSRETEDRSQETGDRRQEIISIYSSDTPHPTPHTLPPGKAFCRKPNYQSESGKAAGQQAAQNQWPLSLLIS